MAYKNLKSAIQEYKLSYSDVAQVLDKTPLYVQNAIEGNGDFTLADVHRLMKVFDTKNPEWLFESEDKDR